MIDGASEYVLLLLLLLLLLFRRKLEDYFNPNLVRGIFVSLPHTQLATVYRGWISYPLLARPTKSRCGIDK